MKLGFVSFLGIVLVVFISSAHANSTTTILSPPPLTSNATDNSANTTTTTEAPGPSGPSYIPAFNVTITPLTGNSYFNFRWFNVTWLFGPSGASFRVDVFWDASRSSFGAVSCPARRTGGNWSATGRSKKAEDDSSSASTTTTTTTTTAAPSPAGSDPLPDTVLQAKRRCADSASFSHLVRFLLADERTVPDPLEPFTAPPATPAPGDGVTASPPSSSEAATTEANLTTGANDTTTTTTSTTTTTTSTSTTTSSTTTVTQTPVPPGAPPPPPVPGTIQSGSRIAIVATHTCSADRAWSKNTTFAWSADCLDVNDISAVDPLVSKNAEPLDNLTKRIGCPVSALERSTNFSASSFAPVGAERIFDGYVTFYEVCDDDEMPDDFPCVNWNASLELPVVPPPPDTTTTTSAALNETTTTNVTTAASSTTTDVPTSENSTTNATAEPTTTTTLNASATPEPPQPPPAWSDLFGGSTLSPDALFPRIYLPESSSLSSLVPCVRGALGDSSMLSAWLSASSGSSSLLQAEAMFENVTEQSTVPQCSSSHSCADETTLKAFASSLPSGRQAQQQQRLQRRSAQVLAADSSSSSETKQQQQQHHSHIPLWSSASFPHTFMFLGMELCGHSIVPTSLRPWLFDMGSPAPAASVSATSACLELPDEYVASLAAWIGNVTCTVTAPAWGSSSYQCSFAVGDFDAPIWPPAIEVLLGVPPEIVDEADLLPKQDANSTGAGGGAGSSGDGSASAAGGGGGGIKGGTTVGGSSSSNGGDGYDFFDWETEITANSRAAVHRTVISSYKVDWIDLLLLDKGFGGTDAREAELAGQAPPSFNDTAAIVRWARGRSFPLCIRGTGTVREAVINSFHSYGTAFDTSFTTPMPKDTTTTTTTAADSSSDSYSVLSFSAAFRPPSVRLGLRTWRRKYEMSVVARGVTPFSVSAFIASFVSKDGSSLSSGGAAGAPPAPGATTTTAMAGTTGSPGDGTSTTAAAPAPLGDGASSSSSDFHINPSCLPSNEGQCAKPSNSTTGTAARRSSTEIFRFAFASDRNRCFDSRCVNLLFMTIDHASGECRVVALVQLLIVAAVIIALAEIGVAVFERYVQKRVLEVSMKCFYGF